STAGRLQQRVVQEEEEAAAGSENTADLGQALVDSVDVLEDETGDDGVERLGREWQRRGVGSAVHRCTAPLPGDRQLAPRRVDANDSGRAHRRGQAGHLALAAS